MKCASVEESMALIEENPGGWYSAVAFRAIGYKFIPNEFNSSNQLHLIQNTIYGEIDAKSTFTHEVYMIHTIATLEDSMLGTISFIPSLAAKSLTFFYYGSADVDNSVPRGNSSYLHVFCIFRDGDAIVINRKVTSLLGVIQSIGGFMSAVFSIFVLVSAFFLSINFD